MPDSAPASPALRPPGRRWLLFFGLFSLVVGGFALAQPLAMTTAIEQVLGIVLLLSGGFSVIAVIVGRERSHRVATVVLALIRLAAGGAFLGCVQPGIVALTALLGAFFVAEGVTFVLSALMLRPHRAWLLVLLNGLVALVLGGLIFAEIPSGSPAIIGFFYGIYSLLYGISLLGLALARRPGP